MPKRIDVRPFTDEEQTFFGQVEPVREQRPNAP